MENENVNRLKPIQITAAQLLATGCSISAAAEGAGCGRHTVHAWLKNDDVFLAFLNGLKNEQVETTRSMLRMAAASAIDVLVDIMKSSPSDATRMNAATKIIEMSGIVSDKPANFNDCEVNLRAIRQCEENLSALF